MLKKLVNGLALLKKAFQVFSQNEPLRMAASTAFFATFALPAILIILIQVLGLIAGRRTVGHQLIESLSGIVGVNSAMELRNMLVNVRHLVNTWYIAAGVFVFLLFVATTLFKIIKDSLNQLWQIRVLDKITLKLNLENRVKAFIAILLAGVLFLAVLLTEGLIAVLGKYAGRIIPGDDGFLDTFLKQAISWVVVAAWFTMLFKFLTDGRPAWRVTIAGGIFTGTLFTFGKLLLGWLLSYSSMQNIYGTSTSFVLLLLFIFYSSFMFYYGACVTRVWGEQHNQPIMPARHAVKYTIAKVDLQRHES